MACIIPRPDAQTLFKHYSDLFSSNVLGGAPIIPESNEWYAAALNYAMAEEFYAITEQQLREQDPRYACCENLIAMAAKHGVFPKTAQAAQGYVILTGTPGSQLPSTIEIIAGGKNYRSTGTVPAQMSTGTVTIQVRAIEPGPDGNASGNVTTGQLATAIVGVNREVTVCGGRFCGGAAAEGCEAFRSRYIERLTYKPRATSAWIKEKLLEWPCATRVCERLGACCPEDTPIEQCGDNLQFYVMFDGSFPCGIAPDNITADINKWMFGERQGYGQGQVEVGVCGSIHTAKPHLVNLNIDIDGCPTPSQQDQIKSDVADLFTTICPSQILRARQVELIVANVLGADVATFARFTSVTPNPAEATISTCGDVEPACDYLPCLNSLTFTGPNGDAQEAC